jgi:hypothetical protein
MSLWKNVILNLLLIMSLLPAQNYLWPTDASKNMTSSFGEFRPRHFHAAIDIKTWAQTGYKIFAIEDGYVYRILVSSSGYGKAIYLKLYDGNIVVYGHLNGFIPALEDYTDSLRLAAKNNTLDIFLKPFQFPVHKGELLGYTGDTGIGVPHLHFEIRDSKNNPINPLQFYDQEIVDKISPFSTTLAIIPLSATTLINFSPDTLIFDLTPNHKISIPQPIYLTGKAYIALKSFDQANGVYNKFSIYKAILYVNDSMVYQVKYDKFSYADTRLVELDRNYSLWRRGIGVFHNFYRHKFNHLSFYGNFGIGSGVLSAKNLNHGANNIRIELYDFDGNESEVHFRVIYHNKDQLKLFDLSKLSKIALVGLKSTVPLQKIKVQYSEKNNSKFKLLTDFRLKSLNSFMNNYFYSLSLSLPQDLDFSTVKINSIDEDSNPLIPLYFGLNQLSTNAISDSFAILKIKLNGDRIAIKTRNQISALKDLDNRIDLSFQLNPNIYYTVINIDIFKNSIRRDAGKGFGDIFNWVQIIPGKNNQVFSSDRFFSLSFPTNAVYDTFFCNIAVDEPELSADSAYPLITPIYITKPFDQVLNWGAYLNFTMADSIKNSRGLGVYYWNDKKGWLYLPSSFNPENNAYQARITSLEKFVVIKDSISPEIALVNQADPENIYIRSSPLRISVRDKMAGISKQEQISVYIDDQWSLFRYDPEEDLVIISPKYIAKGRHRLKLIAIDNVGNKTEKEFFVQK